MIYNYYAAGFGVISLRAFASIFIKDRVFFAFNVSIWLSYWGFPGSSEVKASACNAEGPDSIPGVRRSRG